MKFKIYVQRIFMLFIFCFLFAVYDVSAQTRVRVQGVVKSSNGETLPGVSVQVKDTNQGVVTDLNGRFSITTETGKILVFTYLGFKPLAQGVTEAATLNIVLEEQASAMDEVVVIGYGTQKKSSVTGAVSKLVNTNLDEIPTSRLDNALIGKIAGVSIQNITSEVGAEPVVRVRGFNSISANSSPLVVVDGYPVPDGLSFVNPQDVESVEVLKDAASAAIYGSRAANGVILITTKSGVSDKPRYSVKTYYGFRDTYKLHPILNFTEYVNKLYDEAALRALDPSVAPADYNEINSSERAAYIIENQIVGEPTDWQKEGLDDAPVYNVQMGLSGGKSDLKYYVSGNVLVDNGIMKYSENTRANVKAKIDGKLGKKTRFNINFNPSYIKTTRPTVNFTDYYRFYSMLPARHNAFSAAYVNQTAQWGDIMAGDYAQARHFNGLSYSGIMPDGTVWNSNGPVNVWATNNNTPISIADRSSRTQHSYRMLGGGDISFDITKDLIFKTSLGGYFNYREDNRFTLSAARQDGAINEADLNSSLYLDMLWENTLNYTKKLKNHNFTGLLGFTTQQTTIEDRNIVGRDFPSDNFETLNQASQIDQALTNTFKDRIGLISYLGRLTYDYKSKYLFATTLRADGSSYFAEGNKYGWFPSVSAGWIISSEPFLQDANWLSNLKLRSSYGATGNNRIESFSYTNLLYRGNYSFGGGNGSVNSGLAPSSDVLGNPSITWERTFEHNTGLDMGFLKNRLSLTLEYYNSVTDQLLFKQNTMSFSGSFEYFNNAGKIRNRGLEIEFSSNNVKTRNFDWSTSMNFSANRNKLLELGGEPFQYNFGERNEVYAAIVGQPSIQFFGYKTDGIWTSETQIDEAQANGLTSNVSRYFQPGGLKFVDTNGDNQIDPSDRVALGTPFPDFLWGINNTFKYKSFDLNVLIQGSQGGKLINGDANYNESKRFHENFTTNRWLSEAYPGDGKTPYFTNGVNWMLTDYVMEDASYASLRNVIVGYTLPSQFAKKVGLQSMRVYSSMENLLYFMGSDYRGVNPEARTTSSQYSSPLISGYQRGGFPLMRTFTLCALNDKYKSFLQETEGKTQRVQVPYSLG